ncbi:MAG TPA: DNA gyrase inhibitor YacG [Candidatus Sulfotelmatobacter sp.]
MKLHCPICKKAVTNNAPEFPFCSPRCRTIDLGKWASGGYVVSSPVTDAEETLQDPSGQDQDRNQEE